MCIVYFLSNFQCFLVLTNTIKVDLMFFYELNFIFFTLLLFSFDQSKNRGQWNQVYIKYIFLLFSFSKAKKNGQVKMFHNNLLSLLLSFSFFFTQQMKSCVLFYFLISIIKFYILFYSFHQSKNWSRK